MIHSELGVLTQESLVKRIQRSVSVLEEPAKNMKDIFSFYLLSLVRFSLGGGNRPEHGTHLGLGQVWTGLNMCVLDGGGTAAVWTGCWRDSLLFSFSQAWPRAGLHCSRATRSTEEMGFINTFKSTSGFGDLWAV